MAITGIGNSYNNMYEGTYAGKNESAKKETKEAQATQAGNAKKSNTDKAADYYSYLQKNFDCVKNGNVSISGAYLKQCANDPEKAKELEDNLSYFKEGYEKGLKSAQANARAMGATLVDYSESWSIDSKGNITVIASTTLSSGNETKGWKKLAKEREEKLKEKKEQERIEEKKKQKKEQEEAHLKIQTSAQPTTAMPDAYHKPLDIKA